MEIKWERYVKVLFWFEVSVDDAQTVEMVQGQSQFCKVELHILFCKHYLRDRHRDTGIKNSCKRSKNKMLLSYSFSTKPFLLFISSFVTIKSFMQKQKLGPNVTK